MANPHMVTSLLSIQNYLINYYHSVTNLVEFLKYFKHYLAVYFMYYMKMSTMISW